MDENIIETVLMALDHFDQYLADWGEKDYAASEKDYSGEAQAVRDRIQAARSSFEVEGSHPAFALMKMGRWIQELSEDLDDHGIGVDGEPFDTRWLADELSIALDHIDRVIARLYSKDES